jgi:hypothetical protein
MPPKGNVPGSRLAQANPLPRKGSEEPWRGTLCRVEEESYLFTSGYVPWWDEFPGAHIPAPLKKVGEIMTKLSNKAASF